MSAKDQLNYNYC